MTPRDRRAKLLLPASTLNGIDFVEVAGDDQTALRVHFLNLVQLKGTLGSPPVTITGGERVRTVTVRPIQDSDWSADDSHVILNLRVSAPGDFSPYTLTVNSPKLDPYFSSAVFSFKARCPSDLACRPAPPAGPAQPPSDVPPIA